MTRPAEVLTAHRRNATVDNFTGMTASIALLTAYESQHDVTFLALPTEALLALRHDWAHCDDATFASRAVRLIRDAFDGYDGDLHALTALPEKQAT